MSTKRQEVVIIGGGIAGVATAYYLSKAGAKCILVEKDSIGSHASGFAYGGLSPLGGAGIPGPVFALAEEGARLHRELARSLPEETGINTEYRPRPTLTIAFTPEEVTAAKAGIPWQQGQPGYTVRWLEATEARALEPRISSKALGGTYIEGTCDLEPYRLVLALAQAAEKFGATIRHGKVTGLRKSGEKVTGVILDKGDIACDRVVIAMGPWSKEASAWLGVPIEVRPLKGQILRLRAPGAPFRLSVTWNSNYATTKPDGLLWAGTTEEEVGFDESPTPQARDKIMAALLKMVPSLGEAQLAHQTACLRPLSGDRLPVLGEVPGLKGVYMATGAGRNGILLGPAMGRIMADLIVKGRSPIPLVPFAPGRFAAAPTPLL